MRGRDIVILLVVLTGVYFLVRRPLGPSDREPTGEAGHLLPRFDPAAVTAIELGSRPEPIRLVREGDHWMIEGEPPRHAAGDKVTHALGMLLDLDRGELVSVVPGKHALFEVDGEAGRDVAVLADGDTLAALVIGKPGPSRTDSYVRARGENEVYLSGRGLAPNLLRPAAHWRDRNLLPFDPNLARSITVAGADTTLVLERGEGAWAVVEPTEFEADPSAGDRLLLTLSGMTAMGFADEVAPDEAGLDIEGGHSPPTEIAVELDDGGTRRLWIGERADDEAFYARRPDRRAVYLLAARKVTLLTAGPSAYRP